MNRWTQSEVEVLKENYNKLPNDKLLQLFPNRTYTSIYKKARTLNMYRNDDIEFENRSRSRKGDKCCNWKGGSKITRKGYVQVLKPEHPRADINGYVMEHIYVFEQATGIKVPNDCVVHHIDGNKQNNDISNLCLMTFGAHTIYHNHRRKQHE